MEYKQILKDSEKLEELEKLHYRKTKLKDKLSAYRIDYSPFIVELSGLPRTGKTMTAEKVYDFFKFGEFNIERTTEPAHIIKSTHTPEELKHFSNLDFNDETLRISRQELKDVIKKNPDIIIQDRGVIDNYFWYQMMYINGVIDFEILKSRIRNLREDLADMDQLYVFKAAPSTIVLRDYLDSIYLEDRKKTTTESVSRLRDGIDSLTPLIGENLKETSTMKILDTTSMDEIDTAIMVANSIIDGMEDKYVKVRQKVKAR